MIAGGYLQMLQKGIISGEQLSAGIDTVARNVQQIITLVNNILFLQEMELVLPEFQAVDMNEVARAVLEKYASIAQERGVMLRLLPSPGLPPVSGDSKSLERALMALVDNAIKFSPQGGEVQISLKAGDETVLMAVKDHGIGIPPENTTRIFDRFYHLEKSGDDLFGGIGLGLSITNQVIAQHDGRLEVVSTPGKGSTFTMTLKQWKEDHAREI